MFREEWFNPVQILLGVGGTGFEPDLIGMRSADRVFERLDIQLGQLQLGGRGVERGLVRPGIDDEQQVTLLDVLIVDDLQFRDRPAHVRCDFDRVGANVSVVSARINVVESLDVEADNDSRDYDRNADQVAGESARDRLFGGIGSGCGVHQIRLKKISHTMHPIRIVRLRHTTGSGHR